MSTATNIPTLVGRYVLLEPLASGGMATVHFGRLLGAAGFNRTVAIKRLQPRFAKDPEFCAMFLDEARMAARVQHPNVVPTLDVVATRDELLIVMEYVAGETLSSLVRWTKVAEGRIPPPIVASVVIGCLNGLHAAHEAKNERGEPLGLVHRDVSPQNVLVAGDGIARLLDFGVAKATGRLIETQQGYLKGKLGYAAPEQLAGAEVTRRTDLYAATVVLYEALTGTRMFAGTPDAMLVARNSAAKPPSHRYADLAPFDALVARGLARNPAERWASAREMARDLEACSRVASAAEVAEWLERVAGDRLRERAALVTRIESDPRLADADSVQRLIARAGAAPQRAAELGRTRIGLGDAAPDSRPEPPGAPRGDVLVTDDGTERMAAPAFADRVTPAPPSGRVSVDEPSQGAGIAIMSGAPPSLGATRRAPVLRAIALAAALGAAAVLGAKLARSGEVLAPARAALARAVDAARGVAIVASAAASVEPTAPSTSLGQPPAAAEPPPAERRPVSPRPSAVRAASPPSEPAARPPIDPLSGRQ